MRVVPNKGVKMKKLLIAGLALLFAYVPTKAANYKSDSETQSALSATTNGTAIDLRGYTELSIYTDFATCTGTTNSCSLIVQTSMDNSNWINLLVISDTTDAEDWSGWEVFDYLPDSNNQGFGRYVRYRFYTGGTASVSYTIRWEAKD
jgi:hypothetical protein